jgi:CubicO group peptidase (beta-lactamase class C family)
MPRVTPTTVPALPDTPAGQRLAAWLQALNTGDHTTIRDFIQHNYSEAALAELSAEARASWDANVLYNDTRGLTLVRVERSADQEITALTQAKLTDEWLRVAIKVAAEPPHGMAEFGIFFVPPPADTRRRGKLSETELVAELQAFVDKLVAADLFSGAVLVAKEGAPLFQRAYGLASKSFNTPNRLDTKLNLASMNKMFTGVAVAQLAQRGRLAFDDLVGAHLPEFPNKDVANTVTIHHLLTHTSGLGAYWNDKFEAAKFKLRTVADFLALFIDDPLAFRPGERFEYSNSGYVVLGAIVEQVSGQSYYDYVREQIYRPAGMSNTDAYELDQDVPNLAIGYTSTDLHDQPISGPRRNNLFMHGIKGGPAGGGYSTVEDLLNFDRALRNGRLLTPEYAEIVLTGKVEMGPGMRYAYGFGEEIVAGKRIVGHGGGFPGISTQLDMYLDHGYTVAIMSNYDPPAAQRVTSRIKEMILQE